MALVVRWRDVMLTHMLPRQYPAGPAN